MRRIFSLILKIAQHLNCRSISTVVRYGSAYLCKIEMSIMISCYFVVRDAVKILSLV